MSHWNILKYKSKYDEDKIKFYLRKLKALLIDNLIKSSKELIQRKNKRYSSFLLIIQLQLVNILKDHLSVWMRLKKRKENWQVNNWKRKIKKFLIELWPQNLLLILRICYNGKKFTRIEKNCLITNLKRQNMDM